MREWLARFRDWLRRDRLADELREELRFHEAQAARNARDLAPAEAADAARRQLGNITRVTEATRDRWSIPSLESFWQDVRYAIRSLRRSPGFAITVVLTLALGIGANAAMFSVIDRLMFRPYPYLRDPAEVHRVYLQIRLSANGPVRTQSIMPYTRYLDFRNGTRSFSTLAAVTEASMAIGTGEAEREQPVEGVSASFFSLFDARPVRGRFFQPSEDSLPRGDLVAVLSYEFWASVLGKRDVIGQPLQIGTLVYDVIGIAPPGFTGIATGEAPSAYIPITTYPANQAHWSANTWYAGYNWDWIRVIVQRKPQVSAIEASADLSNAYVRSRNEQRLTSPAVIPTEISHPRAIAGPARPAAGPDAGLESRTLLWVSGVAVIVLLIACANVTNLMLARVLRRRREIAMRIALGVSRRRLASQFVTESVLLALAGCAIGVLIAQWSGTLLRVLMPDLPAGPMLSDARTLFIAAAFALGAALVTAVGPAFFATRGGNLAGMLRAGMREGTYQRSRARTALLLLQGALSVTLLVGAGLFVRSLEHVRSMHMGYDAHQVLIAEPNYRGLELDSVATIAARRRLLEVAQEIAGVQYAARFNSTPFSSSTLDLVVPGIDSVARLGRFDFQLNTPDYFKVMGTRIVRGRSFTDRDGEISPLVAVVSQAMARVLWPDQNPIGQCMHVGLFAPARTRPCTTVIGVAENVMQRNLTDTQQFFYYLPVDQMYPGGSSSIALRVSGADAALSVERVRQALQQVMPGAGYVIVTPLQRLVDVQQRSWTLGATMFGAFGALALLVAAVGLYGVISYNVSQRMQELAVRIALGARAPDIVRLVVGQGVLFAAAGVTLGLLVSMSAAHWIQPLLFDESARDPATYAGVAAVLFAVAVVASAVPSFRATRADPNRTLRAE